MDTTRIHQILADPDTAHEADLRSLEHLCELYPYSQYLRILTSRISQHLDNTDKGLKLNSAAIYASDRSVLKQYITDPAYRLIRSGLSPEPFDSAVIDYPGALTELPDNGPATETEEAIARPEEATPAPERSEAPKSRPAFLEVLQNLANLRTVMQNFNNIWNQESRSKKDDYYRPPAEEESSVGNLKTTSEALIDLPALDHPDAGMPNEGREAGQLAAVPAPEAPGATGIPEPVAREYQNDLIERFIRRTSDPGFAGIPPAEAGAGPAQEDLAANSTRLSENAISENLARILHRQGKVDLAIDIYRKLIWKFPQKKAYFADQIEKLLSSK
jgi:tetratricopeptide (TPR) repeat protein